MSLKRDQNQAKSLTQRRAWHDPDRNVIKRTRQKPKTTWQLKSLETSNDQLKVKLISSRMTLSHGVMKSDASSTQIDCYLPFKELPKVMESMITLHTLNNSEGIEKAVRLWVASITEILASARHELALFTFPYFNNTLPMTFDNFFKLNMELHSHNTRSSTKIHIDHARTNYKKYSTRMWYLEQPSNSYKKLQITLRF